MRYPDLGARMRPVLHYTGLPIDARTVTEHIAAAEQAASAPARNGGGRK
jgi:hypothetical protein